MLKRILNYCTCIRLVFRIWAFYGRKIAKNNNCDRNEFKLEKSKFLPLYQWFSNCVPRHFGVPSEIQRVPPNFFANTKYSRLSIEIWCFFN
jgi:hypothetical protein